MTRLRIALAVASVAVAIGLPGAQQTRDGAPVLIRTGTATISGVVFSTDARPLPVRDVRVTLNSTDGGVGRLAQTDGAGRFVFRDLPAGRFLLESSKPAWIGHSYGARRPGRSGVPVALADGQSIGDLRIPITRGAVATGLVRDERGQPLEGVAIEVLQYRIVDGERRLQPAIAGKSRTDENGAYRAYGLPAGETYIVAALPPISNEPVDFRVMQPGEADRIRRTTQQIGGAIVSDALGRPASVTVSATRVFAASFFPGAQTMAAASSVMLVAGEERSGVDIVMPLVSTSRVSGVVTRPDGTPASGVAVSAVEDPGRYGLSSDFYLLGGLRSTRTDASGRFAIVSVPSGEYLVRARSISGTGDGSGPAQTLWAQAPVMADGRDVALTLALAPGMALAGRMAFDGSRAVSTTARPTVSLVPIDDPLSAPIAPGPLVSVDGGFEFTLAVTPGAYRLVIGGASSPWWARSAIVDGQDILDVPLTVRAGQSVDGLVVTFTDRPTQLVGALQGVTGAAAPDHVIVVFSTNPAFWTPRSRRIRQMRPTTTGEFDAQGLPPGDYFVGVVTDAEDGEWFVPSFLEALVPAAVRVTLREGQRTVQNLRIAR